MRTHTFAPDSAPTGLLATLARDSRPLFNRDTRRKLRAAQEHLTGFADAPLPTFGEVSLDCATVGDFKREIAAGQGKRYSPVHDAALTFDAAALDSLGVFSISQLERYDQTLNEPLYGSTYMRDIQMRTDIGLGYEAASYTQVAYAMPGGTTPNGKQWISALNNVIPGPSVDLGKISQPLWPYGYELSWSVIEQARAQLLGQPIDLQKAEAARMKYEMDCDAMVYVGDSEKTLPGSTANPAGMLNSSAVTAVNAAYPINGTSTPQQVLGVINTALTTVYNNTSNNAAYTPDQVRLPPTQFSYIVSTINANAGNASILTFLNQNNLSQQNNGRPLNIQAIKWLTAANRGAASDRMYVYTNSKRFLQFPMVPLQRTPLETRSLQQMVTYYGLLGVVEHRYPETELYVDGV